MYIIRADFQRFCDVNLIELIGAVGVYVIWDAHAKARPTYIGEGNILKRLSDHVKRDGRRFSHPWNGYVAVINTDRKRKNELTAIERLLLEVAYRTDRGPSKNVHPGNSPAVLFFCRDQQLRINVYGYDPLVPPDKARKLSEGKCIKAWFDDENNKIEFYHDWRLRRLGKPIN